jgi:hypothetical protein
MADIRPTAQCITPWLCSNNSSSSSNRRVVLPQALSHNKTSTKKKKGKFLVLDYVISG